MNDKHLYTALLAIWLFSLPACQSTLNLKEETDISRHAINTTVSVAFAPDGKLWRLTPTRNAVFIDSSADNGQTFSKPVQVNPNSLKTSAWPENPPAIAFSSSGRIHVLYYADAEQKSTSYYTFSDDNGQTFSPPALISDHATSAKHYMDKMMVDRNDNIYLFWHDMRHEHRDQQHGSGVLSLYYTVNNPDSGTHFENRFISSSICSCCRTATAFDPDDKPVVLVRMVFPGNVRDHALIHMTAEQKWSEAQRITHDNWKIEACPEHGPALAVDDRHRSHLTWFTLGDRRGIFYAQTDDYGRSVSEPMALGNADRLPSHPDVIAFQDKVVLTWKEFDGERTYIQVQHSFDRGKSWTKIQTVLSSTEENGHPALIKNAHDIFLSWFTENQGHQIVKL